MATSAGRVAQAAKFSFKKNQRDLKNKNVEFLQIPLFYSTLAEAVQHVKKTFRHLGSFNNLVQHERSNNFLLLQNHSTQPCRSPAPSHRPHRSGTPLGCSRTGMRAGAGAVVIFSIIAAY